MEVVPASSTADAPARAKSDVGRIAAAVAISHGLVDAYAGFLPPLLPRIMANMGLSIALATTLAMTFHIASSFLQPALGWLADRYGRRLFVAAGPAVAGVFLSLIGSAPTFTVLVALLIAGGLGSAAFHPPAASLAARVSEGGRSGARMSVFSFGGALGYAIGPLAVIALVTSRGLGGMWIAMLPALLWIPIVLALVPAGRATRPSTAPPSPREVLAQLGGPLGLVFGVSAIGAFIQRVYLTMAPIIVARGGGTEAQGALAISTYLAAQALGTVFGGIMTDRGDRRALLAGLTLWSVPAHVLAFWLPPDSAAGLAAAALSGFLNMAMLPPVLVMAQEMLPARASLGAGIVMGLAWGAGSIGVLGTGVLGDMVGPQNAALLSVPMLFVATALARHPSLAPHARRTTR